MLNALSRFIPEEERIITIEDTAELQLQQRHVVKFETRPPNLNKEGGINQRQLLRTALRMRPDRIIVGECRGAEALDMLQAMNTGVEGSMSTVHANTPRDAFSRLETMVMMADLEIPTRVILQQLASAIKLVVQVSRLQDGTRKMLSITEVLGVRDEKVDLQEIFTFERIGVTDAGKVQGRFRATGVMPKILERLRISGIQLPPRDLRRSRPGESVELYCLMTWPSGRRTSPQPPFSLPRSPAPCRRDTWRRPSRRPRCPSPASRSRTGSRPSSPGSRRRLPAGRSLKAEYSWMPKL